MRVLIKFNRTIRYAERSVANAGMRVSDIDGIYWRLIPSISHLALVWGTLPHSYIRYILQEMCHLPNLTLKLVDERGKTSAEGRVFGIMVIRCGIILDRCGESRHHRIERCLGRRDCLWRHIACRQSPEQQP